jgi:uncharacterized protein (TIGR00266 family)
MICHNVDYQILGDDLQLVEVELDPGEKVIAEAGAMTYMEDEISFQTRMGDGTPLNSGFIGTLMGVSKRLMTGESVFLTHFENQGFQKSKVAFAAPYPGKIIPIDLNETGGTILCQKDAFLCAAFGTQAGIAFQKRLGAGFFGGEGFILQKLTGDGKVFIHVGGTVIKKTLQPGQTLRVDTGCIAAMTDTIDYSIARAGNLKSMVFGGEGLFLATLKGPGTVYLQSLPFSRLADRIFTAVGGQKGEGSLLSKLG